MAKDRNPANLSADEVEALKIGRKGLAPAMRNLVVLTHHPNPSQQRQAIELLLKHTMADRGQQMQADGTFAPGGSGDINISINKVDVRLLEVMDDLPPHLKAKWAMILEEIEEYADASGLEIFEGEVLDPVHIQTCECGCGAPVNKGKRFVKGHHFKKSVSSPRVQELRQGNPLKMNIERKQAEAAGKLPVEEQE